jgi:hypothetical protein
MFDATVPLRKFTVAGMNGLTRGKTEEEARAELVDQYGADNVWNTEEVTAAFEIEGFAAPFCVARRRSDGQRGSLAFTHMPRFYYDFQPV